VDARGPARTTVRAPARTGARALPRVAALAPLRTAVPEVLRTSALAPRRTGAPELLKGAVPAPPRTTAAQELLKTGALATVRTVVQAMPVTAVPQIAVPAAQGPVRRATAAERHLLRQARVQSAELHGAPPTADREGTAGRLRSAGVQPHARVTSHGGQEAPGRAAPDQVLGLPAAPAQTENPAGRPAPRPATGRDEPHQAAIRAAAPGPGVLRAGPPMPRADVAEVPSAPMTADPPRAAEPAVPASLVRRVPAAAVTRARVLRVLARTARAATTPTGARPAHVALDLVATARRIGQLANAARPPGGHHVTGRRVPHATEAATDPRGRLAAARATVPAPATVPGAASGTEAVAGSAPAADARGAATASAPAADVPGPRETRLRPGRPARPGRSFQTPSLPSSSTPRRVPS
jgi:pilus assembly protein FimV